MAVPAAAESVTAASAECVEILPRTGNVLRAGSPAPEPMRYNSAVRTWASPMPSPMKRKMYFALSRPSAPRAPAARRRKIMSAGMMLIFRNRFFGSFPCCAMFRTAGSLQKERGGMMDPL